MVPRERSELILPTLASRRFDLPDQERFAVVSGDYNPVHLDPILARRTQAAAPVVHGVHLLLWALDALASNQPGLPRPHGLRARFHKFVRVGDCAEVLLTHRGSQDAKLQVCVGAAPMIQVTLIFEDSKPKSQDLAVFSTEQISRPPVPLDLRLEQMSKRSGHFPFATSPNVVASMFPAAAQWFGARRVAALAASSHLVGMICPGLHSIFRGLSLEVCTETDPQDSLAFRVTETDPRFGLVRQDIAGGGLAGTVESFARVPPVSQATMQSLLGLVDATEFAGTVALVVGGSRGLGELTSKLVATGGGHVVITYRVGRTDAERVAQEITQAGGTAEIVAYDARRPATEQLIDLPDPPTHAYYFATPLISRDQSEVFSPERFHDFSAIYVDGFWHLAMALRARRNQLSMFYPSSVFVSDRRRNMTEYAMAKAAGETLCANMNLSLAPLHVTVNRLPRLATDQTASIVTAETPSAVATLLPIVREVQSWPR